MRSNTKPTRKKKKSEDTKTKKSSSGNKLAKLLERNIKKGAVAPVESSPAASALGRSSSRKQVDRSPGFRAVKNPNEMNPDRLDGPNRVDGELFFSKSDLMQFELLQERVKSAASEVKLEERELSRLDLEYESKRLKAMEKVRRKKEWAALKVLELQTMRREIELVYEVDLKNVVYDDETGKITVDDTIGSSEA